MIPCMKSMDAIDPLPEFPQQDGWSQAVSDALEQFCSKPVEATWARVAGKPDLWINGKGQYKYTPDTPQTAIAKYIITLCKEIQQSDWKAVQDQRDNDFRVQWYGR